MTRIQFVVLLITQLLLTGLGVMLGMAIHCD